VSDTLPIPACPVCGELMLITKPARLTGDPTADPGLAWCCHPRDGCRSPALVVEQGDPWIDVLQWSPGAPVILRSWMHLTR
jgi:hypothetical protein